MPNIVPPTGMVASLEGKGLRLQSCRHCFYHDVPHGGVPLPSPSTPELRAEYQNRGYCRRGSPAPTESSNKRIFWPLIHLDRDWCGSGEAL